MGVAVFIQILLYPYVRTFTDKEARIFMYVTLELHIDLIA